MKPRRASHGASHAGDGLAATGYPTICSGCGTRVKITGDRALWFETTFAGRTQNRESWHFDCKPRGETTGAVASSGGGTGGD